MSSNNKSVQPRKQRLERYSAPLHKKQKYVHVHLTKDLRQKYGFRNVQVRKGDKVKLLRGQFKNKEDVVERVDLKKEKVFVKGVELIKKDGTKSSYPLNPSNLMITNLDLSDKKRKAKLNSKSDNKVENKDKKDNQKSE